MKALMYPMKIEYQREAYREVIDEEFTAKKFDALLFNQQQKAGAEVYQTGSQLFPAYISDTMKNAGTVLDNVLDRLPFSKSSAEYRKIRISLLLNIVNSLKINKKLDTNVSSVVL